LLMKLYRYLVL